MGSTDPPGTSQGQRPLDSSYALLDSSSLDGSLASSTHTLSDLDSPLMIKHSATTAASLPPSSTRTSLTPSRPTPTPKKQSTAARSVGSRGSSSNDDEDDRKNWINGKRPKGYRTKEGKEAAERCKAYKSSVTVPHLSYPCNTYEGVLKHALLGAIRSGGLTYGIKAFINLSLGMLKLMKGRGSFIKIANDAFLGRDAVLFGSFFGMFSFLWKLVNNGLRLYRGVDDRINGAIAGAIAGLSLLIETPERRVTFAQQMLMRSVQGVYNAGKFRGQFSLRHGDAVLFAIGSAQVLYAYTMHPDTIPKEFFTFMVKTARVPAESLALNRSRVRGFPLDLKHVREVVDRYKPTAGNLDIVSRLTEYPEVIPCAVLHPSIDSCRSTNMTRLIQVTRNILPVYATLNFVPLLALRLKRLMKDPIKLTSKTAFNTLRSSVFLAIFVSLYQTQICIHRNALNAGWRLGDSKYLYWLFGLTCAGSAIMVEQEGRRAELAMYVLPKAATSLYKILNRKNWVKGFNHWEVMTFSFAMSLIMSFYQQEEQVLSPFVTKLIYHILGRS